MNKYAVGTIVAFVIGIITTLSVLLDNCSDRVLKLSGDLQLCKQNKATCDGALETCNNGVEAIKNDYAKRLADYIKSHPVEVVIPDDVNLTRSNCDDIKSVIDAISAAGL
ncbi:MAG: hypothetical protein R3203_10185 [Pseudoalteromonas tetraodonis]|nr:hypothetical protein [Pseudoalteromonas tetraodonis]